MKILLLVSSVSLFCLCSYKYSSGSSAKNSLKTSAILIELTTIKLVDSKNSVTIECTKSGNKWVVSDTSQTSAYLTLVAKKSFGISNLTPIQDIEVDFDSLYTVGALTGKGNKSASSIPIGVQYELTTNPPRSPASLVTMGASETHTCTGAPCSCCKFSKAKNGKIQGCYCSTLDLCRYQPGDKCNHTVVTTR